MDFRQAQVEPWTLSVANRQSKRFWTRRLSMLHSPRPVTFLSRLTPLCLFAILALPCVKLTTARAIEIEEQVVGKDHLVRSMSSDKRNVEIAPRPKDVAILKTGTTSRIMLTVGKTTTVTCDGPIVLSEDAIDSIQLKQTGENEYSVVGNKTGVFHATHGKQPITLLVVVDATELRQKLKAQKFNKVEVTPVVHGVVLQGQVGSPERLAECIRIAEQSFSAVIDQLSVRQTEPAVLVELELLELTAKNTDWFEQLPKTSPIGLAVASMLRDEASLEEFKQKLKAAGKLKTVSAPKVVTVSGRPASIFLGKELPILVPQSEGEVATEFKQVGTSVKLVPTVLGNGHVRLECETEVSEIVEGQNSGNGHAPKVATTMNRTAVEIKSERFFASTMKLVKQKGEKDQRFLVMIAKPKILSDMETASNPTWTATAEQLKADNR
ncbi:MAG: hypothetical protein KDB27_21715 [Planctomycetales bacterium]|nr:hypothetical protein [Planctomycetales bacterium]